MRTAHCCVVGSCLGSGYRAGAVPGFGVVLHCGRAGLGVHVLPGAWWWCTGVVVVTDFCVGFLQFCGRDDFGFCTCKLMDFALAFRACVCLGLLCSLGFPGGRVSNIEPLNFLVPRNVAIRRSNLMIGVAVYRYQI